MNQPHKLKTLYVFEVLVPQEVTEREPQTNEAGETLIVEKKVKKDVPRRVSLRKPTRALLDDAELYFNVLVSKGIQAGLMSRALLAKRFNNDGGVLSDPEKQAYAQAYYELEVKEREFVRLTGLKDEQTRNAEENERVKTLTKEIGLLRRNLQDLEIAQLSLYDITAESRARTKTILWWVLHLTYMEKLGATDEWEPLFKGETVDELMNHYDAIEEGEGLDDAQKEFYYRAIRRAAAATAFWFYGRASKQEDFASLEEQINQETTPALPPAEGEKPAEKTEEPVTT